MNEQNKWGPALWGGVFIGVISGVPVLNFINCACCAGIIAGGMLSVYLFRRQLGPDMQVNMSDGAILGLLAGLIGAVIATVIGGLFGSLSADFLNMLRSHFGLI